MIDLSRAKLTIGKLRAVGSGIESLATRSRLATILDNTSLHTTGLPSSAAVFIRKLRDPLPGSLRLRQGDTHPPLEWERALAASLDHLVRIAALPALGPVPVSAEAVIFQDRSDLLACLASDWIDGSAVSHWWWQSLFRATDVTSAVAREWLTSVEYVPAAFAKLAQKGNAIKFAGSLPHSAVGRLLDEITLKFGLTYLCSSLSHSKFERQPLTTGLPDQSKPPRSKLAEPLSSSDLTELRTRLAPEAFAQRLKSEARLLLVVALMLERAPAVLRERNFAGRLMASLLPTGTEVIAAPGVIELFQPDVASEIERPANKGSWTEQPITHPRRDGEAHTGGLPATPSGEKHQPDHGVQQDGLPARIERRRKPEPVRLGPGHLPIELDREPGTANQESIAPPARVSMVVAEHPLAGGLRATDKVQATEDMRAIEKIGAIESVPATDKAPPTPELRAIEETGAIKTIQASKELPTTLVQQSEVSAAAIEIACETKFGGIFYLINAALALNLYSDFTRPLDPGIELSIWDFLALIGRELNGKQIESDPIWMLLARLAGRRQSEPGNDFNAPEEWRLPSDWLDAFPEPGDWSYQTSRGRLIVRHPEDFTVLSVKLGPRLHARNIAARLANETSCYSNIAMLRRRRFVRHGFGLRGRELKLERWTRGVTDYLRARLARAVGIEASNELTAMLFARAARVEISPARLDVFLSLAELPVEVRLSGLDRDPGWVPAAGRFIAFHFD